jgi:hypothetical protein
MADTENGSPTDKEVEGKPAYKIRLKVMNRETAQYRYVTLDEAKEWDWDDVETWRMIGGWQVTSFQQLLNILYLKMQKGYTEVEMLEAPRFTMLAGG